MRFHPPLVKGFLHKRYKRFLADIQLENGQIITAHCANSGAMTGLITPGSTVWVTPNTNPKAKLDWRWELASQDGNLVSINTVRPNGLVFDWITQGEIPLLSGYQNAKREVKYGPKSRLDVMLSDHTKPDCYVEIKNVTMMRQPHKAEFPDAVTTRGTKHLNTLLTIAQQGKRAVMLYFIARSDATSLHIASDIDPAYAKAFTEASRGGVEVLAMDCHLSPDAIEIGKGVAITPPV